MTNHDVPLPDTAQMDEKFLELVDMLENSAFDAMRAEHVSKDNYDVATINRLYARNEIRRRALWRWVLEREAKAVETAFKNGYTDTHDTAMMIADGKRWRLLIKHAAHDKLLMAHMGSIEKLYDIYLIEHNPYNVNNVKLRPPFDDVPDGVEWGDSSEDIK